MDFETLTNAQLINLADTASVHSDDPVTQVGAMIFSQMAGSMATVHAANQLPPGIKRDTNTLGGRAHVLHAEQVAIGLAAGYGVPLSRATLVSSRFPCYDCAALILTAGITHVLTRSLDEETELNIEAYRMVESRAAMIEGGIDLVEVDDVPYMVLGAATEELH